MSLDANTLCPTCQHPMSAHDAIGLRWCAVSARAAEPRDCICSGVVATPRVLSHY